MEGLDHSVYPDVASAAELPNELTSDLAKADYIERICGAWDFDVFPERATFEVFRGWREIFDRFPLPQSPAYHSFRSVFGWPAIARVANPNVHLTYRVLDRLEGREPDPWEDFV